MTADIWVQPDIVKMVVGFLRLQPEVLAWISAGQIRGQVGSDPSFPVVRVTRVTDAGAVVSPPVVDQVTVQLDVWGGNNRQAERIAAVCKAALVWRGPGWMNDEGQIVKVETRGMSSVPDTDYEPPRQRYIVSIDLWTKPIFG